jgi:hypothetical protein
MSFQSRLTILMSETDPTPSENERRRPDSKPYAEAMGSPTRDESDAVKITMYIGIESMYPDVHTHRVCVTPRYT